MPRSGTSGHHARQRTAPARVAPASTALSAGELVLLRGMLAQQRDFRLAQLAQLRRTGQHELLRSADREINESLASGARAALRDVLEALRRMDAGCYGTCRACRGPVELERLEILPQLALCMPCQRAAQG